MNYDDVPVVYFTDPGTTVTGVVIHTETRHAVDRHGNLRYWDDGTPRLHVHTVIDIGGGALRKTVTVIPYHRKNQRPPR